MYSLNYDVRAPAYLQECELKLSVWVTPSAAEPLIFQTRNDCCHAPSSVLARSKRALNFNCSAHTSVSLKAFVFVIKGYVWFSEALKRGDFLLSSSFAEAVCCTGRCDFNMQASKVGGFMYMLKKTTRSKCTAVNLVQRQNQPFFFAFVLLFPSFIFHEL